MEGVEARIEQVLSLADDQAGERPDAATFSALQSFRRFCLLATATEAWATLAYFRDEESAPLHLAIALWLAACTAIGWPRRFGRIATAAAAVGLGLQVVAVFPTAANHQVLAVLCLGLLALPHPDEPAERELVLRALRWLVVIGLFAAGLQKLLFGYWLRGELLAYAIWARDSFAVFFQPLLAHDEWQRLRDLRPEAGAGPFLVDSPLLIAISNATWLAELVLPVLLLRRGTRRPAVVASIVYLTLIELGARELFFGGLMVNLLLLFWPSDVVRRTLPIFAAAYFYLLLVMLGIAPHWEFR